MPVVGGTYAAAVAALILLNPAFGLLFLFAVVQGSSPTAGSTYVPVEPTV